MPFFVGDYVTRNSYNNDTIFRIIEIKDDIAILVGVDVRLYADSNVDDLKKIINDKVIKEKSDREFVKKISEMIKLNRNEYFYLPGKILHIDGDKDYLKRCMDFYKQTKVRAFGLNLSEDSMAYEIEKHLKELSPDIVVITGHDAYYKKKGDINNINNYRNTKRFIDTVNAARKYEKNQDKLIIIAGACQSNYEALIKAGSNFASSPKRINIHALDPAIVACSVALSSKNKEIDLINIIDKTKYGSEGIGGIITNGTMYVGYPR